MKTTSINRNLVSGLAAIILFFMVQAATVLTMGRFAEREVVDVARRNMIAQVSLAELSTLVQKIRRYEKEYFIYVDTPEKRAQYQKEWTGTMEQITALLGKIRSNADSAFNDEDAWNVTKWWSAAEFYESEMGKVFLKVEAHAKQVADEKEKAKSEEVAKSPKSKEPTQPVVQTRMLTSIEANDMIKAGKDRLAADLIKGVTDTFAAKSQATLALTSVTNEGFNKMIYGVIATVLIGIAIGLYLLITLPRSVSRPIEQLTKNVNAISRGDAASTVAEVSVQEFQALSAAIERMRVAQEFMVQRLRKPADPKP